MALQDGWFSERNEQWAGVAISFKVDETLWDQKSEYQHVQVFKTAALGNVLVLDGVVQVSEKDEMAYQEMITHIPMFAHPNPEYVLIVGGGDGGVIREALKHPSVKEVTICEIDQMVIDVSKKFLPSVAVAWDDPKVKLHRGDAAEYIKRPECKGKFDVIVSDTSDPVGPAEALFKGSFYQAMSEALRPGGKVATQAESIWLHLALIANLVKEASPFFANVEYAVTQIPTYPLGQIGFLLCSAAEAEKTGRGKSRKRAATPSCRTQVRSTADAKGAEFRYYSDELHSAAFVLPAFATKAIFGGGEPASASSAAEEPSAASSAAEAAPAADDGKKGKRAKKK